MQRFADKLVLITGGSSGIGLATAKRLADEGARLVLVARSEDKLAAAVAQLSGEGHRTIVCDVVDEKALAAALKPLREELGPFHAAALCAGAHLARPLAVSQPTHFEDMFRANVGSAVAAVRAFLKVADKEGASIVLVSSGAAIRGGSAVSAYSAAKGALLSLGRSLAVELAPRKVRVNNVVPGVVKTPMSDVFLGGLPPEQAQAIAAAHPLGLGEPEDVAAAIAFLASSDARWITGSELIVDGGLTCK
jgi:NAD(P)-dependent dehydrogenase (short-subunit alcohol dehydrogenase family)